jgi:hypothetical protein
MDFRDYLVGLAYFTIETRLGPENVAMRGDLLLKRVKVAFSQFARLVHSLT